MVEKETINCWIISSGLIGCENQCIGLAEELNFNYEIKKLILEKFYLLQRHMVHQERLKTFLNPGRNILLGQVEKLYPI